MAVELKQWSFDLKEDLIRICNQADRAWLSERLPNPYTAESADWWLNMVQEQEGKDGIFRAILSEGKVVGNISVERKADVYAIDGELVYLLLTEYWNRGIMTRAVEEICQIAFDKLELIRITANVYEPNIASVRVLEKNGFILEGRMRKAIKKADRIYDVCIYGKVR